MTWYINAGYGDAKGHALRSGDYVDPRDEVPTLAEAQRDEAEAHNGPEVSGGSSDGRAPVSGDERSRTPQQSSRRSGGPGFDSPSPLTSLRGDES